MHSVRNLQCYACPLRLADPGDPMTNATVGTPVTRKPKRTMLYLLIVLFVISYSALTRMVIDQTRTINSQRSLIHLLFKDNQHYMAALKAQVRGVENSQDASKKIPLIQVQPDRSHPNQVQPNTVRPDQVDPNQVQSPAEKFTSEQIPSVQVPADKAKSRTTAKSERKGGKAGKRAAPPPVEMTDPSDMRRVLSSI